MLYTYLLRGGQTLEGFLGSGIDPQSLPECTLILHTLNLLNLTPGALSHIAEISLSSKSTFYELKSVHVIPLFD
jgi:hypothetical protein